MILWKLYGCRYEIERRGGDVRLSTEQYNEWLDKEEGGEECSSPDTLTLVRFDSDLPLSDFGVPNI